MLSTSPEDLVRGRVAVGDVELTVCTDGTYLLDGGAIFGVVPKSLWQKRLAPDENNLVRLGLNTVVVRTGRHTVVIETGIGNKQSPRMRGIFQNQELLPASLHAAGVDPAQVDLVVNTHLHFDHCGWNTTLHPGGAVTPTFPNARYFAHRGEVEHGRRQLERDAVSYNSPNYDPLVASGQMTLLDLAAGETAELCPGVGVELFPGHTANMMAVHVQPPRSVESRPSAGAAPHACYVGDLVPTAHHLDITWGMAYDLDPLRCIEERKRLYARAIPEQWIVLFTHDHATPFGRVRWNDKGKPVLDPVA